MVANVLTLSRLGVLSLGVWLLYLPDVAPRTVAFVLVWVVILVDAVDGPIARRRGEASALGSHLDIAIDRIVEFAYWIVFTDLQLVPVWVVLVVVTRGTLTDGVRAQALARGHTPFEMMRTRWGRLLVASRFVRAFYGTVKAVTFAGLAGYLVAEASWRGQPEARLLPAVQSFLMILVYLTVALNLLRGVPVLIEARRLFDAGSASRQRGETVARRERDIRG